jgi:hypothetical protein
MLEVGVEEMKAVQTAPVLVVQVVVAMAHMALLEEWEQPIPEVVVVAVRLV